MQHTTALYVCTAPNLSRSVSFNYSLMTNHVARLGTHAFPIFNTTLILYLKKVAPPFLLSRNHNPDRHERGRCWSTDNSVAASVHFLSECWSIRSSQQSFLIVLELWLQQQYCTTNLNNMVDLQAHWSISTPPCWSANCADWSINCVKKGWTSRTIHSLFSPCSWREHFQNQHHYTFQTKTLRIYMHRINLRKLEYIGTGASGQNTNLYPNTHMAHAVVVLCLTRSSRESGLAYLSLPQIMWRCGWKLCSFPIRPGCRSRAFLKYKLCWAGWTLSPPTTRTVLMSSWWAAY